jgi:hypothetical protein
MKQVLKFKFQEKEGYLSVVERSNFYYSLVQKETPKVIEIQKTHRLLIAYDLKNPEYQEKQVQIIHDFDLVKWVYEALEKENNLYFKHLDDTLCVIEIAKETSS